MPWTLLRWEVEYLEDVLGGRTRPLVLRCSQIGVNPHPVKRSLVVKALGLPEITQRGLVCELFGNMLAREAGVVTPTPAIVEIDAETVMALNVGLATEGLSIKPGLAVGATYLRGLLPVIGSLPDEASVEVPTLFGFDLAVQNPDRRTDNPNCALYENHLLAYDFEMCFSFLMTVGATHAPWEITKHGLATRHIMYPRLNKRNPSWSALLAALRTLDANKLDALISQLPTPWQQHMDAVRAHVLALCGALTQFEGELQECVA